MGNPLTSHLPKDIDTFLQDVAQSVEIDGKELDYTDIFEFAPKCSNKDIAEIRSLMNRIYDEDIDILDPETEDEKFVILRILNIVKGEKS